MRFSTAATAPTIRGSRSSSAKFDTIVRDFITHERRHVMMEDRDVFPAALKALEPQDWTEIASALTNPEDPLFSEAAEETFDALRARILQLEQQAEAERH